MKRGMAVLGIAAVFALSACGNGVGDDEIVDEPVPIEEQPLPGEDGVDDDLEEMDEDTEPSPEETTDEGTNG